ncbi:MAG TPA: ribosome assembly cofactor RimP [Bacteroidales bacterium]|nr:ribosome assembly cofactor RimP [Bacteroidales bacterium]
MIAKEKIRTILEERLLGSSLFLAGISIQPGNRIQVYLDGDQAVTIADCQQLSRYLESKLDRNAEDFELTVSSAGLDQPLKFHRQYPKHIGERMEIVTLSGEQLKGRLTGVEPDRILLEQEIRISRKETETKLRTLDFGEIKSAKVEIPFGK